MVWNHLLILLLLFVETSRSERGRITTMNPLPDRLDAAVDKGIDWVFNSIRDSIKGVVETAFEKGFCKILTICLTEQEKQEDYETMGIKREKWLLTNSLVLSKASSNG